MIKKGFQNTLNPLISSKHALKGIKYEFKNGRNFAVEIVLTFTAIFWAIVLRFSYIEISIITLCGFLVLTTELVNAAIEETWNKLHPGNHPDVGRIKDLSAGAVLVMALGAMFAGGIIFFKHFLGL